MLQEWEREFFIWLVMHSALTNLWNHQMCQVNLSEDSMWIRKKNRAKLILHILLPIWNIFKFVTVINFVIDLKRSIVMVDAISLCSVLIKNVHTNIPDDLISASYFITIWTNVCVIFTLYLISVIYFVVILISNIIK